MRTLHISKHTFLVTAVYGIWGQGEVIYQNCYGLIPSLMNIKGLHSTVQKLGLISLKINLALAFKSILKKRKRKKRYLDYNTDHPGTQRITVYTADLLTASGWMGLL